MTTLRALLGLACGPLLALVVTALLIPHVDAYWRLLRETSPASPYYVDTTVHYAQTPRVIVFGSSIANRDIDERLLSDALGDEVLNLGVPGIQAAGSAMWVPDIIDLAPAIALLAVGPAALATDEVVWLEKWHPGVAWDCFGPAGLAATLEDHLGGFLGWVHPLQRHREGFYKRAEYGRPNTRHPRNKPRLRDEWMALQLEGVEGRLSDYTVDGTGPNMAAVRVMKRRLEAAGIHFVVAHAPTHPGMDHDAVVAPSVVLLDTLAAEGVDVLPLRDFGDYPERLFSDPLHLLPRGQRRFTNDLAQQLRVRLEAR